MSIGRWTTPIKTLQIPKDFTGYTVVVTIDQDGTQVTKTNKTSGTAGSDVRITKHYNEDGDFDYSEVAVYLSQADTGLFEVGNARIQVRYIDVLGNAQKTDIASMSFDETLLDREIEYGE